MFKRAIVLATLVFASAVAFAIPKPSEVKAAFVSGDYARAETMLKEVMVERPTAAVHYQLGQVYSKQGKHSDALNEFRQAQALDPSLKFASSASAFTRMLADEQNIVAPPPVNTVASAVQHTSRPAQNDGSVGTVVLVFFGVTVVFGLLYFLYTLFDSRRMKTRAEEAKVADNKDKTNQLLLFSKQLEDAALITKTAIYSDLSKRQILDRIVVLQTQVRNMLGDVKAGVDVSFIRLSSMESNVDNAVDNATNGLPVFEQKVEHIPKTVKTNVVPLKKAGPKPNVVHREQKAPVKTWPAPQEKPDRKEVHHHETVTIVNHDSSSMATGIMLGSMLHDHSARDAEYARDREAERAAERRQEAEERRIQQEDARQEREAESRRQASRMDTNDDDSDNYRSSGSSTLDTGSSSSDSYTSSDSGSMDSGSTSTDSY